MSDKDKLVIRRNKVRNCKDKSLTVPEHIYTLVKRLAAEANIPVGEMAAVMIDFATERLVIEE